jgi:hypothetical protein
MENEARTARHLAMLAELGELAMAVARRTGKEAAADDATPAQVLSFERAARAVRTSIAAEAKLASDRMAHARPARGRPGGRSAGRRGPPRQGALAAMASGTWQAPQERTETDRLAGETLGTILDAFIDMTGVEPDFYGWSDEEITRPFAPMRPSEPAAPDAMGHDPP